MRRLVVVACTFGLLLALAASSAAAKEIAVPVSHVVLVGDRVVNAETGTRHCAANSYLQWSAQAGAEGWRLEYLWNGSLKKKNLKPPFSDSPHAEWGWSPPAGAHWHFHGSSSRDYGPSSPKMGCGDFEAGQRNAFGGGTIYITVPDTPEDEEKAKEEEEKKRQEEEKTPSGPPDKTDDPPGKKGKATCRGKTPTIFVKPGPPTNGTARRDVIMGTPKRDVIRARGGNDLVCGLGGNDIILGGAGRDVLLGQRGADTIRGQGAKDVLLGGNGADRLLGQAAADRLFGQAGTDFLSGGPGRPDLCNGGAGRDQRRSPGCERRKRIP